MTNITDNASFVLAYDANQPTISSRVLTNEAPHDDEHAAQCVVVEMCRGLMASGMDSVQYNNMTQEEWDRYKAEAVTRASLNVTAPVAHLDIHQQEAAVGLGGMIFDVGYTVTMDGIQQADKITFTKLGGL